MNEQNGKTPMWLWITLIVVILAGIGFFAWAYFDSKNHTVQPDQATLDAINNDTTPAVADDATDVLTADDNNTATTTDSTADWKTYTNDTYGYSIKYPSTVTQTVVNDKTTRFTLASQQDKTLLDINADTFDIADNITLDNIIANLSKNSQFSFAIKTTLVGVAAYEGVDEGLVSSYGIIAKNNGHVYELVFNTDNSNNLSTLKSAMTDTQKTMLSTFQFTK